VFTRLTQDQSTWQSSFHNTSFVSVVCPTSNVQGSESVQHSIVIQTKVMLQCTMAGSTTFHKTAQRCKVWSVGIDRL